MAEYDIAEMADRCQAMTRGSTAALLSPGLGGRDKTAKPTLPTGQSVDSEPGQLRSEPERNPTEDGRGAICLTCQLSQKVRYTPRHIHIDTCVYFFWPSGTRAD
jgi:hypothetical protein